MSNVRCQIFVVMFDIGCLTSNISNQTSDILMVIGILQIELTIDNPTSIKDKRKVVSSLKDKMHNEHQVSVAEVDKQDDKRITVLGIAMVTGDAARAQSTLDKLVDKLRHGRGYQLADHAIEVLSGR